MQYQTESILRIPAASENPVLPRRKVAQNACVRSQGHAVSTFFFKKGLIPWALLAGAVLALLCLPAR